MIVFSIDRISAESGCCFYLLNQNVDLQNIDYEHYLGIGPKVRSS